MKHKFITIGEIMLRLTPPDYEKIRTATSFEARYGGSEANVALSLANLGVDASFFTVVPGNSLGKSAVRMLRSNDVNCDSVVYSTEEETPVSYTHLDVYKRQAIRFAEEHKDDKVLHVMATGANYNVAYTTTTCILMECQWIHSNPIHSGEFFHGPFEVVDKEVPFLVLVGVGREREMDERAVDFLKKYGKRITVLDGKEFGIDILGPTVAEYLSPLVFTGVLSRYSHRLADARNHSVYVRRYMWHVPY